LEEDCSGADDLEKTHTDFSHVAATALIKMFLIGSSVKTPKYVAVSGAG
jgi:hypothetical protein